MYIKEKETLDIRVDITQNELPALVIAPGITIKQSIRPGIEDTAYPEEPVSISSLERHALWAERLRDTPEIKKARKHVNPTLIFGVLSALGLIWSILTLPLLLVYFTTDYAQLPNGIGDIIKNLLLWLPLPVLGIVSTGQWMLSYNKWRKLLSVVDTRKWSDIYKNSVKKAINENCIPCVEMLNLYNILIKFENKKKIIPVLSSENIVGMIRLSEKIREYSNQFTMGKTEIGLSGENSELIHRVMETITGCSSQTLGQTRLIKL